MNCSTLTFCLDLLAHYFFQKFEQEKYSLQREIELKNRMLESLSFECDALKQQQNVQLDKQKEQLTRVHGQEVNDLKYKVWYLIYGENVANSTWKRSIILMSVYLWTDEFNSCIV